jgi:FemAB-related protein (PEP-CTERM system-associated)
MLVIESLSERTRNDWDAFVMGQEHANFFHLSGWKDAVERAFDHKPHYLAALRDNEVCGVLPMFELKSRLFGHSLVSVPFGVYGGVLAADRETEAALTSAAASLGEMLGVDYVELRGGPDQLMDDELANGAGNGPWQERSLYVTFRKEILESDDENLKAIPRKQRAVVRKGIKNGLTSRTGREELLDAFYDIYATNVRDLGTPVFSKRFFEVLLDVYPDAFILLVDKGDVAVGGVFNFVFRDELMPYYGAGLREYFRDGVNDFMYWELMRWGRENGFKVFDFGRSKRDTGSYKFKRHWGFEEQDLDYRMRLVQATELPNVSPTNPKYKLFIEGWRRLPVPVAKFLGPRIVRNIP